ncbi:LOW QUALITY PROTEIN: hypothetical protein HID58_029018, partial [Brassica napus]
LDEFQRAVAYSYDNGLKDRLETCIMSLWKVLDHGDSDDVLFAFAPKRQHSCSGLLMLATVNVHRLTTYVTRRNQNFILPESPLLILSLFMNVHFANATQVKWSVQVCFLLQYSYGPRPQPSSKIVELAERIAALSPEERKQIGHALSKHLRLQEQQMISHEGESKTRGWNQKSIGKGKACVHKIPVYLGFTKLMEGGFEI